MPGGCFSSRLPDMGWKRKGGHGAGGDRDVQAQATGRAPSEPRVGRHKPPRSSGDCASSALTRPSSLTEFSGGLGCTVEDRQRAHCRWGEGVRPGRTHAALSLWSLRNCTAPLLGALAGARRGLSRRTDPQTRRNTVLHWAGLPGHSGTARRSRARAGPLHRPLGDGL